MKHSKILMMLIIVFLLIGLGTLSAADVTQNDSSVKKTINMTKTNTIHKDNTLNKDNTKLQTAETQNTTQEKQKTIQKTLKEKNKKQDDSINDYYSLGYALAIGTGPKILNIQSDIKLDGSITLGYDITSVTINGNNHKIIGNNHRFLSINYGQVVSINNITLTNCSADEGGAIYVENGKLSLNNCNFINNNATEYGGAIFYKNAANDNTYINNTFTNNTAKYGGGASATSNSLVLL